MKTRKKIFKSRSFLLIYIITSIFIFIWSVGPILWSFMIAITPRNETMNSPARFFPSHPTFSSFTSLIISKQGNMGQNFLRGIWNSIFASAATIIISLPIMLFGAYALSRMEFRGRKIILYSLMATLVIPVFACMIPLFNIYISLGLIDNLIGLILIYVSSFLPLIVSIMSSYFSTIPRELEDAASIDGCGRFMTIVRIIIPNSYPVILSSSLILLISTWNQFLIPLVFAPSLSNKPIAVVISEFITKQATNYSLMNAGGLLAIIPPVVIAIFFRKFLSSGITAGATKG